MITYYVGYSICYEVWDPMNFDDNEPCRWIGDCDIEEEIVQGVRKKDIPKHLLDQWIEDNKEYMEGIAPENANYKVRNPQIKITNIYRTTDDACL